MEEPPDENDGRHNDQAEGLVAPECAPLFFAPLLLGNLLQIWLDAAFDHVCILPALAIDSPVRYASV
jgi:hypothetical protein